MERTHGGEGIALIECISPKYRKYRVRWDIQPYVNEEGESQGVTFLEKEFRHKPTMSEIKETILGWMNSQIDQKILSGFVWNDMPVWLSTENQFNYKAAFDLAMQTNGTNLPITFKFGTTEEPIYYEFSTTEELTDFYVTAMNHINNCLAEGWSEKDSVDWSNYELALK